MSGRLLDERLGRWHFWFAFVSFNVAFFPMHILGLMGMPRRVYTYQTEMAWANLNLLVSAGAIAFALSFVLFLWNLVASCRAGARAGENPWASGTLEWAMGSPPPPHNFDRLPILTHREPLWAVHKTLGSATGLAVSHRQLLVSSVAEAEPETRESSPAPSIWPLFAALATAVLFVWSIFSPWAIPGAVPLLAVTLIGWFWPKRTSEDRQ
jgi:cytochrome c oxidase subunit 1